MTEIENKPPDANAGLGKIIFRNTAFVTGGNIGLKVINFLYGVYVVRSLGDDRFGQYSIVLSFTGLFSIFAELGMTQYAMREIAQDRSKAKSFLWNLMLLRMLLAVFVIVGITIGAMAVGYSDELVLGIFLHTAGYMLSAIAVPLEAVLTGNERLDYVTTNKVIGQLVLVVLGAFFLFSGLGFLWLIVASLISIVPQIFIAIWAIRRHNLTDFKPAVNLKLWPKLARAGLPFGIISLALTVAFSIDTVMLSMFVPNSEVGWYNVAYGLVRSLMIFFSGFSIAIVPSLSRAYASDQQRVQIWYRRSLKIIMLLSLPIAVGGMLVADPLIIFLYTEEYAPAALALKIIIWDVPFLMYNGFSGNMTTITSEEKAAARIYTLNAIANVVLNIILIPTYGMLGAAVVTVVTDMIGSFQFHLLLSRVLKLPDLRPALIKVLLSAGGMGLVVAVAGDLNLFVLIAIGAVVYLGLVLVLRLLDESEWNMILKLLRKYLHSNPAHDSTMPPN